MTNGSVAERKGLRFRAEEGTLVHIDLKIEGDFNPTIVGLAIDEAGKGCGAILVTNPAVTKDLICRVKVGRLAPVKAEVKWVQELDPEVMKIGLRYLH